MSYYRKRTLDKHAAKNKTNMQGINIPETIFNEDTGMLIWDEKKIAEIAGITGPYTIKYSVKDSAPALRIRNEILTKHDIEISNRIVEDLRKGYIYEDSPGNSNDYTNFLSVGSMEKTQAKVNNLSLIYYKRINKSNDRVTYFIGRPFASKANKTLTYYISISSYDGHVIRDINGGIIKVFSETEDEDDGFFTNNPSLDELWNEI